tara:strand:+ start:314 stop:574 length:261 start_codon:yes stop_codon:yes gene_type:complete
MPPPGAISEMYWRSFWICLTNCFLHDVESALFCARVQLPPPAAGSKVFAWLDGSCAGVAAQTWEAFIVKFVIGNAVYVYVLSDLIE